MIFNEFINKLSIELEFPLPGLEVQLKMSSQRRLTEFMELKHPENAIKSGVLILIYPGRENPQPTFVVTLRPTYDGVHSGQISLPGGRYESIDNTLNQTALRETNEEVGVDPAQVTIIGQLTELFIPPSNYIVQPFVGFTSSTPVFLPQPEEVAEIIEIPLTKLLDDENMGIKEITVGSNQYTTPSFLIDGTIIWGATAMILNEFKEILRRTGL
jgi:8-oxo-dGTP pyrophosphatase MutT (NUDIX family)